VGFPSLLLGGAGGIAGLERALHMPFARAMGEWSTALLFSNESASPDTRFDYLGVAWSPFHVRLRHLEWQPLPSAGAVVSLRTDGMGVFLSGPAIGGIASVAVTSSEAAKPHVVVARFAGDLPW
jgi:hypothetical protein